MNNSNNICDGLRQQWKTKRGLFIGITVKSAIYVFIVIGLIATFCFLAFTAQSIGVHIFHFLCFYSVTFAWCSSYIWNEKNFTILFGKIDSVVDERKKISYWKTIGIDDLKLYVKSQAT